MRRSRLHLLAITVALLSVSLGVHAKGGKDRDVGFVVSLDDEVEVEATAREVDTLLDPREFWLLTIVVDSGAGAPVGTAVLFDGAADEVTVEAAGYELNVERRGDGLSVEYEAEAEGMLGATVTLSLSDGSASFYSCRQVGMNPPVCPVTPETNSRAWG